MDVRCPLPDENALAAFGQSPSKDAGLIATEYQVKGGLDWHDLREAFQALARCRIIGFEIAEYESVWPDGRPSDAAPLLRAIEPLLTAMAHPGLV